MRSKIDSKVLTVLKWLWIAVVLVAAVLYFIQHFNTVSSYFEQLEPWRLVGSLALMLAAKSLFALISRYSVQAEGWQPTYLQMYSIYALTQLAKYLPGGVWHYVGRFGIYKSKEMSNTRAGKAMVLENVWLVGSALGVGSTLILLFERSLPDAMLDISIPETWSLAAGLAILILWLVGMVLVQRLLTGSNSDWFQRPLKASAVLTTAWGLVGISFALLFPPGSEAGLPLAIGGFSISWAAGFLTLFAPGGIGIREVLLTLFFAYSLSSELATVTATVHRLIWVASEILLGILFSLPVLDHKLQPRIPDEEDSGA